jgi:hypothetical protein
MAWNGVGSGGQVARCGVRNGAQDAPGAVRSAATEREPRSTAIRCDRPSMDGRFRDIGFCRMACMPMKSGQGSRRRDCRHSRRSGAVEHGPAPPWVRLKKLFTKVAIDNPLLQSSCLRNIDIRGGGCMEFLRGG